MNKTLVKYRTQGSRTNEYAVIPTSWLSDLLDWLLSESAEIVSTTNNIEHDWILPISWPSYETCKYATNVSDLMALVTL